jgi:MFS family permease
MFIFVWVGALWKLPILVMLGFFAISSVPVFMAIVMENAPDQRAFANGIYMAVNFLLHSLAVILVGAFSDWVGLRLTFLITAALLPFCLPFVGLLPKAVKST